SADTPGDRRRDRSRRRSGRAAAGGASDRGQGSAGRPRRGARGRAPARRSQSAGKLTRHSHRDGAKDTRDNVKLPRSFYDRPTLDVARDLLGLVLVHDKRGVVTSGIVVEVEAYIGESDPACHAAPGPTARNAPLYGLPGHAYVYLNYGIHCLVNVVTESHGSPAAVLIRALDPLDGIGVMRRRRAREAKGRRRSSQAAIATHDLCRGPGNLTMAMGITLAENRLDLL